MDKHILPVHPVFGPALGVDKNGEPVWNVQGGAVSDFSPWVPITYDPQAFGREVQESAIYQAINTRPMTSNTMEIDRLLNADVGGGSQLTDDTNSGDKVTMYSYQYNGKSTLDEATIEDANADPIGAYSYEWLNSWHKAFDNACLGVSGGRSTTETDYRPYDSAYKVLRTADSATSYGANDNYMSGTLTYDNASAVMSLVESKEFWSDGAMCWIANPSMMANIRQMKDTNNRPLFLSYDNPQNGAYSTDTFMGHPIFWSFGARVSTNFKMTSVGSPLLFYVNRHYITRGDRIPPQSRFIDARINTSALEHTVVHRARQGFVVRVPHALSVLEVTG